LVDHEKSNKKEKEITYTTSKTLKNGWRLVCRTTHNRLIMVVIKGKEKKLKKVLKPSKHGMTEKSKKILRRPQDTQPIATVAV